LKERDGVAAVASFIITTGGLPPAKQRNLSSHNAHVEA